MQTLCHLLSHCLLWNTSIIHILGNHPVEEAIAVIICLLIYYFDDAQPAFESQTEEPSSTKCRVLRFVPENPKCTTLRFLSELVFIDNVYE